MDERRLNVIGVCVSLLVGWALTGVSYGAQEKPNKDMGEVHNIARNHPEEHKRLYDEMSRRAVGREKLSGKRQDSRRSIKCDQSG